MSKALMSQVMMRRLVEAEGAPAAAEFEDVLAVGELGSLGVEGEHELLGLVEGLLAGGVEAAGVFEALAEAVLVERRGDLVVLLVGGGGLLGEGAGLQVGDVGGAVVACSLLADTLGEQAADADADEPVGEEVFFEEGVDHVVSREGGKRSEGRKRKCGRIRFFSETTGRRRRRGVGRRGRCRRGSEGLVVQ
jgi:hypothetical protein